MFFFYYFFFFGGSGWVGEIGRVFVLPACVCSSGRGRSRRKRLVSYASKNEDDAFV